MTNEHSDRSYPVALQPSVDFGGLDDRILLFEGLITIKSKDTSFDGLGKVFWCYLPRPRLKFTCTFTNPAIAKYALRGIIVEDDGAILLAMNREFGFKLDFVTTGQDAYFTEGTLSDLGTTPTSATKFLRLQAHLANFLTYSGDVTTTEDGRGMSRGRVSARMGDWQVVVDRLDESSEAKRASDSRGYCITHVVSVAKTDLSEFGFAEVEKCLDTLALSLSFMRGRWTALLLLYGYETDGSQTLVRTHLGRLKGVARTLSWADTLTSNWFSAVTSGLHEARKNDIWSDTIEHAIYWYIESNSDRSGGIEGAIVLIQAALESLAWTYCVAQVAIVSAGGFDRLPAADRISLLLHEMTIDLAIPERLEELIKLSKEWGWGNGPTAICEIRNKLVHGSVSNRERLRKISTGAFYECWSLGLHYLELSILWLLKYRGTYVNRVAKAKFTVQATITVPWATRDGI